MNLLMHRVFIFRKDFNICGDGNITKPSLFFGMTPLYAFTMALCKQSFLSSLPPDVGFSIKNKQYFVIMALPSLYHSSIFVGQAVEQLQSHRINEYKIIILFLFLFLFYNNRYQYA